MFKVDADDGVARLVLLNEDLVGADEDVLSNFLLTKVEIKRKRESDSGGFIVASLIHRLSLRFHRSFVVHLFLLASSYFLHRFPPFSSSRGVVMQVLIHIEISNIHNLPRQF
ncbi:uncharacterized protein HKW66_Vig0032720 [Vigna angularis]|uniref:Uncharacterized protein n=1 Tax=Phaseolus angularis TaxID=3914 RepID=A0A8T0L6E2_PHAAN|nr:uncharacterized protein HKW66_Vig0032720 [Vigna angularis]